MTRIGRVLKLGLLVCATCLPAAACDILDTENEWERLESEMTRNRKLWERQEIDSYSFVQSSLCECIPNFEGTSRVWVLDGAVTRVEKVWNGEVVREEIQHLWYTVDGLFEDIAYAIDRKAAFLEVEYDPTRGFPTRLALDLREERADDEKVVQISSFQVEGE